MHQTTIQSPADVGAPLGADDRSAAATSRRPQVLLQLAAMVGIGALLYPAAADWFSTIGHDAEVAGYVREVQQLPEQARIDHLRVADEYNAHMPSGVLRDPYTASGEVIDLAQDAGYQAYLDVLRVSDNGVIGEVSYPRLGISLPIYHGTSDDVLSRGAGHLYGSSLPIGGPSTHTVMTSHSGLVNASLFSDLPGARIGDVFTVTVLGQQHHYEVRARETVLPDQTDSLRIIEGEDWVTLITCTPNGVNSHRLLVHAQRIDTPVTDDPGIRAIAAEGRTVGFPWWSVGFLAGSAAIAFVLFAPPRSQRRQREDPDTNTDDNAQREDRS